MKLLRVLTTVLVKSYSLKVTRSDRLSLLHNQSGVNVLVELVLVVFLWFPVRNGSLVCSVHFDAIVWMREPLARKGFRGCEPVVLVEHQTTFDEVLGSAMDVRPFFAGTDLPYALVVHLHRQPVAEVALGRKQEIVYQYGACHTPDRPDVHCL